MFYESAWRKMRVFIVYSEEESLSGLRLFKDHRWTIAEIS